jgi:hypothetical protein
VFGFVLRESAAERVKRNYHEEPDCVDDPERVSEVGGKEIFRTTHRWRRTEEDGIGAGAIA